MVRGPNKQLKIGGVVIDSAESVFLNKFDLHSKLRGCKFSLLWQRLVHSFHTIVPILGFGLQKLVNKSSVSLRRLGYIEW